MMMTRVSQNGPECVTRELIAFLVILTREWSVSSAVESHSPTVQLLHVPEAWVFSRRRCPVHDRLEFDILYTQFCLSMVCQVRYI